MEHRIVGSSERERVLTLGSQRFSTRSGVITWMGSTMQWGYHMDGSTMEWGYHMDG